MTYFLNKLSLALVFLSFVSLPFPLNLFICFYCEFLLSAPHIENNSYTFLLDGEIIYECKKMKDPASYNNVKINRQTGVTLKITTMTIPIV